MYTISAIHLILTFSGETFEFHGGEARIQNHLQGLQYIPDELDN